MTKHELADAMIKGKSAQGVEESKGDYISIKPLIGKCFACALGCALIGKFNGDYQKAEEVYDAEVLLLGEEDFEHESFADLLEIPPELAFTVESKHINGMPIQQIAAWLKTSEGGEV
jgi:hypothetical protein